MNLKYSIFCSILLLLLSGKSVTSQTLAKTEMPGKFTVQNIEISGNSILDSEIKKIVAKYKNKLVDYEDLYQLKTEISDIYQKEGYPNSGAYLPPQKIKDGKIKVHIVEGGVEEINITGNQRVSKDYIVSRLGNLDAPLNSSSLLERLYVLRQDPLIDNVSAELSKGVAPGKSVLQLEIKEAKAFSTNIELGNQKSPAIGEFSRKISLNHGNLLGFGDGLNLAYTNTEGSNAINAGYNIPLSSKSKLSLGYGFADNDVVEDVFNALDLESKSDFWQLGFDYDAIQKSQHNLNLALNFTRQHSETTILDSPFAISLGANEEGITNVSALRFSQAYTNRKEDSVFATRSQFSLGVDLFDATIADDDDLPDGQFFSWLGQTQYVRNLDKDFPLVLRGDLQLSPSELVSLEQFRLGGANTVRGYRRDALLADNGLVLSAEVRIPIYKSRSSLFQIVPFVDFGTIWNNDNNLELASNSLSSMGLGLNFNLFGDNLRGRFDYGIPLKDLDIDDQPFSLRMQYGF